MKAPSLSRNLALPVFLFGAAFAGAADLLTLPKAIELARVNSPAILESRANADAASQALAEARASRLPSVEFREIFLRTDSPADVFGLKLMQERFSFSDFMKTDPNKPDSINNFATELQASMPIYTGGKLSAGIEQARRMTEAASAVRGRTEEAVTFMVATTYMDVLLADRFVELSVKARDTTARHVDQAQAYFDAGMIVESDLLQARVHLARMEESLITARNNATLARAGLNRVMGIPGPTDYDLDPSVPEAPVLAMTLDEAKQYALEHRSDVTAMAAKVGAAASGVARAKGEYLPDVAVIGSYALNDDVIFGANGTSYKFMVMARWNIFNFGQTSARVARSRNEEKAVREAQRGYLQQVEFEVRQAWQNVQEARARYDVASAAVASAEKALAILEARFGQGVARITEVLDAETLLNQSRTAELKARFDVQKSIRALDFASGRSAVAASEEQS